MGLVTGYFDPPSTARSQKDYAQNCSNLCQKDFVPPGLRRFGFGIHLTESVLYCND